jgi:hypothetical protein
MKKFVSILHSRVYFALSAMLTVCGISVLVLAGCASTGTASGVAKAAASGTPQSIVGNWSTSAYGNVVFVAKGPTDGTVTIFDTMTPTYKIDGNKLTLTFGDPLNYSQTGTWEIDKKGRLHLDGFTNEANVLNTTFNPWLL